MPAIHPTRTQPGAHPLLLVLAGGLIAAALDLLFAIAFWAQHDVPALRIVQSIAAGVLGANAYADGMRTAALGLVLHATIAIVMALVYFAASRRLRVLLRWPAAFGALYGVALFLAMNWIVVPLSAASMPPPAGAWLWWGLAAHIILVGIPCALAARLADASMRRRSTHCDKLPGIRPRSSAG